MQPRCYQCPRARGPIAIDGDLGDDAWRAVPEVVLARAEDGAAPRQETRLRLLWDDEHLYAAFEVTDDDIRATHTERDDPLWEEDAVELFLDPLGRGGLYFELEVSPRGVLFDAVVVNRARRGERGRDLTALTAWTCEGLHAAVRVDGSLNGGPVSRGWTVELAVPTRQLAPPRLPAPGVEWRWNAYRVDHSSRRVDGSSQAPELQAFSPTGRADFHLPARFGVLRFTA